MKSSDERASEWIDGRLPNGERDRFQRELADDPEKAAEVKELERVVEVLRSLPLEGAPKDLLSEVQRRIRRRSHGRHYAASWRQRLPFEALVNGLLVLVMVAFYLWMSPPSGNQLAPVSPKVFQGAATGSGLASSVLSYHGMIVGEALEDGGKAVRLTVEVPTSGLQALLGEVSLYPELKVDGEPKPGATADTMLVQVLAPRH
ncbi:MAG: hypothetical protein U1F43_12815 [Myxococcota bacterium]